LKILVIGTSGQLGWEVLRQAENLGFDAMGLSTSQLDITQRSQIENTFSNYQPALVVNTAAYTHVDRAEFEKKRAFSVNRDGPANLAESCAKANTPMIHISTDFVFDGKKRSPYNEKDTVSPLGIYGRSKEAGEQKIRSHLRQHIILRTSWLYGVHGRNFVKTMLKLGMEKDIIKVVTDQYGSPTAAADLAAAVLVITKHIQSGAEIKWGTYHYCGQGVTTWYDFAKAIFEFARPCGSIKLTRVEPITTDQYPTQAKRPLFSALDCSLIQKQFGIKPKPWQESLKITIQQLCNR
jgi:dTDP-4-dehydrorhamnose reductase